MNVYLRTQWDRCFGLNISPVDPLLFVGGQFRPSQWAGLHALGVRAVLNLQAERVDAFEGGRPERTLHLPVRDFTAPSLAQLEEGVAFIVEVRAAQLPVFIHCHSGVGRAPLMAAAYLMASEACSHDLALRRLATARPIIGPNWMQLARLREYEQRLRAASRGQG